MLIAKMARSTPLRTRALRLGEKTGFSQGSKNPLKNPLSKEGAKHQSPTARWVALDLGASPWRGQQNIKPQAGAVARVRPQ